MYSVSMFRILKRIRFAIPKLLKIENLMCCNYPSSDDNLYALTHTAYVQLNVLRGISLAYAKIFIVNYS